MKKHEVKNIFINKTYTKNKYYFNKLKLYFKIFYYNFIFRKNIYAIIDKNFEELAVKTIILLIFSDRSL